MTCIARSTSSSINEFRTVQEHRPTKYKDLKSGKAFFLSFNFSRTLKQTIALAMIFFVSVSGQNCFCPQPQAPKECEFISITPVPGKFGFDRIPPEYGSRGYNNTFCDFRIRCSSIDWGGQISNECVLNFPTMSATSVDCPVFLELCGTVPVPRPNENRVCTDWTPIINAREVERYLNPNRQPNPQASCSNPIP